MKQLRYILLFGFFLAVTMSCDFTKTNGNGVTEQKNEENFDTRSEEKVAEFVADAIEDTYSELKLAELASTKSSNKRILDFAQELANDHTNTLTQLQALADKKGILVPVDEGEDTKEKINALSKRDEHDFDKEWCDELIAKHKKAIREFELMGDKSEDPDLKEIINRSLVTLRAKLDELNILQSHII